MIAFSCLVAILAVAGFAHADYCALASCGTNPHTMCHFTSSEPGERCGAFDATPLSEDQKYEILEAHNNIRADLGNHHGQNFGALVWDNELAEIAQRWANQCDGSLDMCRNVERFQVEQNIAVIAFNVEKTANLTRLVNMWAPKSFPRAERQAPTLVSGYVPRVVIPQKPVVVVPQKPVVVVPQKPTVVVPQKPAVVVPHRPTVVQPQWVYPQNGVQWVYPQWNGVQWVYPQSGVQWVYPQNGVQWVYPQTGAQWIHPVSARSNTPRIETTVSHYETSSSQMVSAKTTNVGCGFIKYMEGPWYATYLVCNYGPGGN